MSDKPSPPEEIHHLILWLECKQICRDPDYKSELFPDITRDQAIELRSMGLDKFLEFMSEERDVTDDTLSE